MSKRHFLKGEGSRSVKTPYYQSRWNFWKTNKHSSNIDLVETFDIHEDFDRFQQQSQKLFKSTILYEKGSWTSKDQYLSKVSETSIRVGDDDQYITSIVTKDQCRELYNTHKNNYTHIGLIVIGIKGLSRKDLGVKAFLTIFDDSIPCPAKKMIVNMEVDMDNNRGLFYCSPDFLILTKDLHVIKIGILTRGYGPIERENLCITKGILAKCVKSTNVKFKCKINSIVKTMQSKGINFIKAPSYSSEIHNGIPWDLEKILKAPEISSQPNEGRIFEDSTGNVTISFTGYEKRPLKASDPSTSTPSILGDEDD